MANKKVHIYDDGTDYRVQPPLIELDGGVPDNLVIKNNTGEDLVIFVSGGAFHLTDSVAQVIPKNKKVQLPAVSQGANASNAYAYQIMAPKSGKRGKGNSDPVLIIEN